MKITHRHPSYHTDDERSEVLMHLFFRCISEINKSENNLKNKFANQES